MRYFPILAFSLTVKRSALLPAPYIFGQFCPAERLPLSGSQALTVYTYV